MTIENQGLDVTSLASVGQLAATFVDFARMATKDNDPVTLLTMLANRCVELLDVEASGILVLDRLGSLRVIGSSSEAAKILDLYQVQNEDGPCLVACRTGVAVSIPDLGADQRWKVFSDSAHELGFRSVYAVPLASQGAVLGALNLFAVRPLSQESQGIAQSLADAATLALLQADPSKDRAAVARRLLDAIQTRNTIEQAKGVLAQRFDESIQDAFARLAAAARSTSRSLGSVATTVVRRMPGEEIDQILGAANG